MFRLGPRMSSCGIVSIVALVFVGVVVRGASAGTIDLKGTHSAEEVRKTCSDVGGEFNQGSFGYMCTKGGNSVVCKTPAETCKGTCPKCGTRQSPTGMSGVLDVTPAGSRAPTRSSPAEDPKSKDATGVDRPGAGKR